MKNTINTKPRDNHIVDVFKENIKFSKGKDESLSDRLAEGLSANKCSALTL